VEKVAELVIVLAKPTNIKRPVFADGLQRFAGATESKSVFLAGTIFEFE
jgi:hypothetical protein